MRSAETLVWIGFYNYLQNCDDMFQCESSFDMSGCECKPGRAQPSTNGGTMARLAKDVIITSQPVRTFPNGDFFFVELSRRHNRYECLLKMARDGNPARSVIVVRAQGKTIRETEEDCYRKALERCPGLPSPPYLKRGSRTARVVSSFSMDCLKEPVEV